VATGCVSSERRVDACKSRKFELVQIKFDGRVRVLQSFLVVVGVGGERKKISQDRFYLITKKIIIILLFLLFLVVRPQAQMMCVQNGVV